MISPASATKLAYTKLKTRRLRLALSLIIVSLLFSVLIAAVVVQAGFFASFNKFSSEGLAGRYIIAGNGDSLTWGETQGLTQNLTLIERAETLQDKLIEQKSTKAKELGLEYQPEWDTAVSVAPDGSKHLRISSEIGKQVIAEHRSSLKQANQLSFRQQLAWRQSGGQGFEAIYDSIRAQQFDENSLLQIKDGKEPTVAELADFTQRAQGFGGITDFGAWQLMNWELLSSFAFEGQSLEVGEDGVMPVIAPSYSIEQELGLEPLTANASAQQKRTRLEELRSKAAGMTFEVCYRNAKSLELFKKATAQQSDKAANGDKEDYQKPALLYGLPDGPCEAPIIESDTRDAAEKDTEAKWQEFNKAFNQPEPVSQILKFRVAGIKNQHDPYVQPQTGSNYTPEQIFDTAFNSTASQGWLSPGGVAAINPVVAQIFEQDPGFIIGGARTFYAELSSAEKAKQLLLENNCSPSFGMYGEEEKGLLGTKLDTNGDVPNCSRDGRQFVLQPFGSNSIAIDQFKDLTQRVLLIAAAAVAALAAIILMGMVGRIIADSRKETAIFRAVGATRLSIMQVYFAYTGFLVAWIVGLSLVFGFLAAFIFNNMYSPDFSIAAAVAFSVKDLSQQFSFIGFNWANLGLIILVVIAASYLAAVIPILRSVRRNPMSDMRED